MLILSRDGQLLLSSRHKKDFEPLVLDDSHEKSEIKSIFKSSSGDFFLSTDKGLIILDQYLTRRSIKVIDEGLDYESSINVIKGDSRGTIYLLKNNTIEVAFYDKNSSELVNLDVLDVQANTLSPGPGSTVFFADEKGYIGSFDVTSKTLLASNSSFTDGTTVQDLLWHKGNLWIASSDGLYLTDRHLRSVAHASQMNSELPHDYVIDLYGTEHGVIVGTYQGLCVATTSEINTYSKRNSDVDDEVLALSVDNNGVIWIGTYEGLFQSDDGNNPTPWSSSNGETLPDRRVMTLEAVNDELWIGTRKGGIAVIDLISNKIMTPEHLQTEGMEVTKILSTNTRNVLVATYNRGLFIANSTEIAQVPSISNDSVTVLIQTESGKFYAGSEYQLHRSEDLTKPFRQLHFNFPDEIRKPLILALANGKDDSIYVGTKDYGIFKFSENSDIRSEVELVRFGTNEILAKATIYSMEIDDASRLWAATNIGIFVIDQDGELLSRLLDSHGTQGNNYNFGSSTKTIDGSLLFGGTRGYSRIDTSAIISKPIHPKVSVSTIETPSESRWLGYSSDIDTVQVSYFDYFLTFNYSARTLAKSSGQKYRHKLQNFDPEWIEDGGRNSATYTNLPPGDYVFMAQAANSIGEWGEDGVRLNVRVLPPFWRTWWAYSIYVIFFLMMLSIFKQRYDRRLLDRRELEIAQNMSANALRMEDELQESHEYFDEQFNRYRRHLRDTLRVIKEAVLSPVEDEHLVEKLQVLSMLEDCAMQSGDPLAVDFRRFIDELVVQSLPLASIPPETITVINAVPENAIDASMACPLALAAAEFLQNALTHAFEPSSKANFIEIELAVKNEAGVPTYQLSVRDDGIGIAEGQMVSESAPGLAFLHRLAAAYSGSICLLADFGTTAVFEVPLNPQA